MTRRTTLKVLGASVAVGVGTGSATAACSYTRVDSPTSKSIKAVVQTEEGPYAAAGAGDILARRAAGWEQGYEKILDAGLTAQGKAFYGADVSDAGVNFWICGESGIVGQYDVVDEQFTDYSAPNSLTNTWQDIAVVGDAGDETVFLVNTSGDVLTGTKTSSGAMSWGTATTFNGGNGINAIVMNDADTGYCCDGNGSVWETSDGWDNATEIGISGSTKTLYDLDELNGELTVAASSGIIYEYDGSSWTSTAVSGNTIQGVSTTSNARIAVGNAGKVYTKSSGSWNVCDIGTDKTLRDVALDDTGDFPSMITGNAGRLYENGDFSAYVDSVTVEDSGSTTTDYEFEVYGYATTDSNTESGDTVDSSGITGDPKTRTVTGTVTSGDADTYDYSGDVRNLTVTSGTADDLTTYVNGTQVPVELLAGRTWTGVASSVGDTLQSVTDTEADLVAVGNSGKLIERTSSGWVTVDKNGPNNGGNNLYGCDASDDGAVVWYGGGSGSVGRYDVSAGTIENNTAPSGKTSGWLDVAVTGTAGSETVYLVNGSGEVLRGVRSGGTMDWKDAVFPGNGSTLRSITFLDSSIGYCCDGNSKVYKTTDGGKTWSDIGIDGGGVTLYDIAVVSEDDLTVVGGSGLLFQFNGEVWTKRKLGGNARYAVSRDGDRGVACGGSGQIYSLETTGWQLKNDDSGNGLQGALLTSDPDVPGCCVGGNGDVRELSFDDPLF
jgi:hypothetical protein